MAVRNYLIEGVSGTGKTTVAEALQQRGYSVFHGDRELSYSGDPLTGKPLAKPAFANETDAMTWTHEHHIWDVKRVHALLDDQRHAISFFCGGSRNFVQFIDRFDGVFVLEVDLATLNRRLAARPQDEFGGRPNEQALIQRLHASRADMPTNAISIDATAPLAQVVDDILARCGATP